MRKTTVSYPKTSACSGTSMGLSHTQSQDYYTLLYFLKLPMAQELIWICLVVSWGVIIIAASRGQWGGPGGHFVPHQSKIPENWVVLNIIYRLTGSKDSGLACLNMGRTCHYRLKFHIKCNNQSLIEKFLYICYTGFTIAFLPVLWYAIFVSAFNSFV